MRGPLPGLLDFCRLSRRTAEDSFPRPLLTRRTSPKVVLGHFRKLYPSRRLSFRIYLITEVAPVIGVGDLCKEEEEEFLP